MIGYNGHMFDPEKTELAWVDTPARFKEMLSQVMGQPVVAIDTESNSLYAYQEQVCLVQISTIDKDYLVDPLALKDLSELSGLFESPDIEKVFHAAEYDLMCLMRDFGFQFNNIFDTMLAGRTLGIQSIGLGSMLESQFGIILEKRFQRANWGMRPLSQEMLTYARLDSHYLIPLRNALLEQLVKLDRQKLFQEDCNYLIKHTKPMQNNVIDLWRIPGVNDLKPRQLSALYQLLIFRDSLARSQNKPHFKVISNQALLEIAQTLPKYPEELTLLPSLAKSQIARYGKGLLQAVKQAQKANTPPRNGNHRINESVMMRKERLMQWRKMAGFRMGVPSDVVLPKDVLSVIAEANPRSMEELQSIMKDVPLRFIKYGEAIFRLFESERKS